MPCLLMRLFVKPGLIFSEPVPGTQSSKVGPLLSVCRTPTRNAMNGLLSASVPRPSAGRLTLFGAVSAIRGDHARRWPKPSPEKQEFRLSPSSHCHKTERIQGVTMEGRPSSSQIEPHAIDLNLFHLPGRRGPHAYCLL